jgi:hypothetical protein
MCKQKKDINMKNVTTALLASTLAFPALAADNDEWIVDAKRNFGRVLQDPLGNFRGVIAENAVYGGFEESDETAGLIRLQGLYAIPMPEYGINFIPRVIVPVVGLPPETSLPIWAQSPNATSNDNWGLSDVILQGFIGPSDAGDIKWGVGPQISLPTASEDYLEAAGMGGGLSGVVVTKIGNWGLTGVAGHLWGQNGDFSTSLFRPFVSYNVESIPGFSISTSPQITYDWKAESGNGWTIPIGGGFTQAVPFSSTKAMLVGLSAYKFAQQAEFGPEWQVNLTLAFMFAEDRS